MSIRAASAQNARRSSRKLFVMSSEVETSLDISVKHYRIDRTSRRVISEIVRDSSTPLGMTARQSTIFDLNDFGEDRFRRFLTRAAFPELGNYPVELRNHLLSRGRLIDQSQSCFRKFIWFGLVLNKLWHDFFVREHVRHPEVLYFHQKPASKISWPRNFVDQNKRHSKIRGLKSRAARSNDSVKCAMHKPGCIANFDRNELLITH